MDDAFRSFPSGHSSFAAGGLIYLSLFLASKLAITIPFLAPSLYSSDNTSYSAFPFRAKKAQQEPFTKSPIDKQESAEVDPYLKPSGHDDAIIAARRQAAAPPVYLLIFIIIPFFASIYIASTRWSDFRHHGFDILFGYFIGTVSAIFAFRYYHLPLSQGAGWAWGPRSRDRSWWAGVGVGGYAGKRERSVASSPVPPGDLEAGVMNGGVRQSVGTESRGAV
jgi:membrane-associated phospholipid phosphatase